MLPNYKNIESIAIHSLFNLYTHDVSLNSEGMPHAVCMFLATQEKCFSQSRYCAV